MSPQILFLTHLVLGYVAWLLCFGVYIWPRLKAMDHFEAQRAIATLHSFRFFGLVFILPGVVSPNLPADFARCSGFSSSPSISWDWSTSSSTTLMPSRSTFLRRRGNSPPPTQSRSSTC